MEKQSLIKYYYALFLVLVVLASCNNAVAQTSSPSTSSSTSKPTIITSPATTQSSEKTNNDMWLLIPSILALITSGGAIALSILKNKEIESTKNLIEKYDKKLKLLEDKYADLLSSQVNSSPSQQHTRISRDFINSSNSNIYLEASIEDISVRVSNLEDRLKTPKNNQESINYSKQAYLSKQSSSIDTDINPFSPTLSLSQSDITQPLENTPYIELVNTYNTNPKLLEQKAIKVSEQTDSINRRHTDSSQKIVLEKANNSNYWVIHDEVGINCWLLPKNKLRIDQFRYETTKALFECHGYQPEYSTFKLIKPAKVISLSADEQTWQLEEPGILEFTVES